MVCCVSCAQNSARGGSDDDDEQHEAASSRGGARRKAPHRRAQTPRARPDYAAKLEGMDAESLRHLTQELLKLCEELCNDESDNRGLGGRSSQGGHATTVQGGGAE